MKHLHFSGVPYASFLAVMLLIITGCAAPQNVAYFQDMPIEQEVHITKPKQVVIKTGDAVSILVSTRDAALSSLFSLYSHYSMGDASSRGSSGSSYYRDSEYRVREDGTIDFPVLGAIEVAGKSREELQVYIKQLIQEKNLVKDPVVTVEFVNLFVTVIGDAGHVGRVSIDRDYFTLLDAISQSGDLQLSGQRENVRVIRETANDARLAYEINFCSAEELYNSPAFYLQQGDVIYVEPSNKIKRTTTTYGSSVVNYTFWMGVLSSVLTLIAIFK